MFFVFLQGLNGFSTMLKKIQRLRVMILLPSIHQRESFSGFELHVSSVFHEALMPHEQTQ